MKDQALGRYQHSNPPGPDIDTLKLDIRANMKTAA